MGHYSFANPFFLNPHPKSHRYNEHWYNLVENDKSGNNEIVSQKRFSTKAQFRERALLSTIEGERERDEKEVRLVPHPRWGKRRGEGSPLSSRHNRQIVRITESGVWGTAVAAVSWRIPFSVPKLVLRSSVINRMSRARVRPRPTWCRATRSHYLGRVQSLLSMPLFPPRLRRETRIQESVFETMPTSILRAGLVVASTNPSSF